MIFICFEFEFWFLTNLNVEYIERTTWSHHNAWAACVCIDVMIAYSLLCAVENFQWAIKFQFWVRPDVHYSLTSKWTTKQFNCALCMPWQLLRFILSNLYSFLYDFRACSFCTFFCCFSDLLEWKNKYWAANDDEYISMKIGFNWSSRLIYEKLSRPFRTLFV